MRILQIGSDRSKRGILFPNSPAIQRQKKYAEQFGKLDIIGFSHKRDGARSFEDGELHVYPTNSFSKLFYGIDTLRIMKHLPKHDVISAQDPFEVGLLALLIARIKHTPLHVQVHTDFLSEEYKQLSLLNRFRAMLAGFVLRRAAGIRVVSQKINEGIEKKYDLKISITVLPIFVNVGKFKKAEADPTLREYLESFKIKVLIVSRLEPEKNVALAIEAFAQSAPKDACLIIAGSGSEKGKLETLVRECGIPERVFFLENKDAAALYPLADVVLVTSKYEGYGLVIIEALAAGKPVISTDVGIAREAGAIISSEQNFATDLKKWFESGPHEMHLKNYPYSSEADYIKKYCADIEACIKK